MAVLIFDTGGLIALDRGDHLVAEMLDSAIDGEMEVLTSTACVAQAWRDPARQARLSRALRGFLERPLDDEQARRCGRLLARCGTQDVVDAAVAVLAQDGDTILTSDPQDIERLLAAAGTSARVRPV
jgi:DNA-binding transcriptional MocR family regulator